MPEISIPYQWEPRPHQIDFFRAMDSGVKGPFVSGIGEQERAVLP